MIFYVAKSDLPIINKNKDCPKCAAGECGTPGCACYDSTKNAKDPIYKDGGRQK